MRRKLISFRPRSGGAGGCYFKVHVEQESGRTLFARRFLLAQVAAGRKNPGRRWNAWPWSGSTRPVSEDVSQHLLDHVLERIGWPFPEGLSQRW
jgi:hypothetical protein